MYQATVTYQIFRRQKKSGKIQIKMAGKQKEWTTQIERRVEAKEEAFTVKGSKALRGPKTQGI